MRIRLPRLIGFGLAPLTLCAAPRRSPDPEPLHADCPGHPDAIGTSRTLVVDPLDHRKIGTMSYSETLPLADHEVVLTFDDGPLPPYTNRVLDILDAQCVKADLFHRRRDGQVQPGAGAERSPSAATPSAPSPWVIRSSSGS